MLTRRTFLAAALLTPVLPAVALPSTGERRLRLYNLHTGEQLNTIYWADGSYISDELSAVNHLLRDHRSGEVANIDPRLLERLHALQQPFGRHDTFHVISGYRSPTTNAALRSHSSGVARGSLHMQGRAIDIRLPGVALDTLRQAARRQQAGGVGYYASSDFIHLDTGRPRFW
jgi:uncharacterized protein YcbK (DUF882 family)